jgi:hypothetical protein
MRLLLGLDIDRCPCCGEVLHQEPLSPAAPPRGPPARDVALP